MQGEALACLWSSSASGSLVLGNSQCPRELLPYLLSNHCPHRMPAPQALQAATALRSSLLSLRAPGPRKETAQQAGKGLAPPPGALQGAAGDSNSFELSFSDGVWG